MIHMLKKTTQLVFATLALAAAFTAPLQAADTFGGTGTDIGTTNCYYVASALGNGVPRVQYFNITSDKSGSVITIFTPSAEKTASLATNASQAVVYLDNSATTFAAGDCVVFRRIVDDSYQRLTVSSATTTNVTMVQNLGATVAIGDIFYRMTSRGTIAVGAATKELNAASGALINGLSGKPLLVDIDGTSACQVNVISGVYEKP